MTTLFPHHAIAITQLLLLRHNSSAMTNFVLAVYEQ